MRRKVYIPNKSIHDFSAAEKFGDLVFLSEGNISKYKTSRIYRNFIEKLKESKEDDYLMISGLTILNIIASLIMYSLHGKVNLLMFKGTRKEKYYIERVIKMEESKEYD